MKTVMNSILTHDPNRAKEDNSVKCKDKPHVFRLSLGVYMSVKNKVWLTSNSCVSVLSIKI